MASIRENATGRVHVLEPEHVVGRAPTCSLRLEPRYISAQHALLRWTGQCWEVKDLGSRNGTFLDGARMKPGEGLAATKGSTIAFGRPDASWQVVDDSAPRVMAVPADGGDAAVMEGDLLALPSADDPRATIYRSAAGAWILEQSDQSVVPIAHLDVFECAGRAWRFSCPEEVAPTSFALSSVDMHVSRVSLSFGVSRDEEHVSLRLQVGGREVDLGARARHYLLLTLARRRLADAKEGLPEASCGWVYQDELTRDPNMSTAQLNIDVFRIRKQFAGAGVIDAASIIERRPLTRQLRIGTSHVAISAG